MAPAGNAPRREPTRELARFRASGPLGGIDSIAHDAGAAQVRSTRNTIGCVRVASARYRSRSYSRRKAGDSG